MSSSGVQHDSRNVFQRNRGIRFFVQAALFVAVGFLLANVFGRSIGQPPGTSPENPTTVETKVGPSMWTCSMHPQIRSPKPGDCPICGMDLIPVAATSGGMRTITLSPEARAMMNIDVTPVERRYVSHNIPMVGKVDFDETKLGYITAWVPGRLDRLYVDYTGVEVNKGDHMVYIYSEQLYAAQQELIEALKASRKPRSDNDFFNTGGVDLLESAREKLRLWGLTAEQIAEIEKREKPSDHLTIFAPVSGIVIEKLKQEGERVALGDRIYTIADLTQVWVHLDAYESDLPWVRYGQDVTVTTESYPGEEFHGRIAFIQPVLDDKTRTVKVRVNVPNPAGKLKPEMFVHGTVRPQVAAGGRVMDPGLAGKWISPMHPEIIKDSPGKCDICGMPLVRAESLGYVTPDTDSRQAPLVIPYSATLVTGTRAVVYVELPVIHSAAEPALQTLATVVRQGKLDKIREAYATFARMLDQPYDQPGTAYAKELWNEYADELSKEGLAGQRAKGTQEAEKILERIEAIMERAREVFSPQGQPTFEGREIVLGPRAGEYYLVRNGVEAGELVVTQGAFKIDSEIQIQAKPSMMTPQGGGGGGHHHGGAMPKSSGDGHAEHAMSLPSEFVKQIKLLEASFENVTKANEQDDVAQVATAFGEFGQVLNEVDDSKLTGHARMLWKEFHMLLSNDAVEGSDVIQSADADRVFVVLKGHIRRMRQQFGAALEPERQMEPITVDAKFQTELAKLWDAYLNVQRPLANDDFDKAKQALASLETALKAIDEATLTGHALHIWMSERENLTKLITSLQASEDIKEFRAEFKPLSEEIGVLAKTFGFGESATVYEMHCPMAFFGKGALWYQENDQARNPYYGSTMLKCADRIESISLKESSPPEEHKPSHQHSHP